MVQKSHQQRPGSAPHSFVLLLRRLQSINFSTPVEEIAESETDFVSKQIEEQERPSQLARSPSLLQRLKFFNLCNYTRVTRHAYGPASETQSYVSKQEREEEDEQAVDKDGRRTLDDIFCQVGRTKSDTEPSSGTVPTKPTRKMEKSASANTSSAHSKGEEDIADAQRSAAEKEDKVGPATEVDAKADDFINKFKQQLKWQRLESIMR